MTLYYETSLYHHGIKGMKWGVRKKYISHPRRSKTERVIDRRNRNAKKFEDRANQRQKQINALKKRDSASSLSTKYRIRRLEKKRDKDLKNADLKREGKLTNKQKAAIVGASIVAAYATYKFVDSGQATRLIAKGKRALNLDEFDFKKNERLAQSDMSSDEIMSSVVSRINPGYGGIGTKNNCRRCTFAYEMSRRGYDVQATKSVEGTGQNAIGLYNATSKDNIRTNTVNSIYQAIKNELTGRKNTHLSEVINDSSNVEQATSEGIFSALSKQPDRARGELGITWKNGGGHSIAWEIINNKPVIFDCQTGKKFDSIEQFSEYGDHISSAGITRLDNVELDKDFLLRWVKNA